MQHQWHFGSLPESARDRVVGPCPPLPWQFADDGKHGHCVLSLGDLPAGQLLLPSYSALGTSHCYRIGLQAHTAQGPIAAALAGVGDSDGASVANTAPPLLAAAQSAPLAVDAPIDAFELRADLKDVRLRIDRLAAAPPLDEWLAISTRPQQLSPPPATTAAGRAQGAAPTFSQRVLDPARRDRACSPVCLAMAASALGVASPRTRFLAATWHSGMYGVWPANLHAATRHGIAGALLAITALDDLAPWLAAGAEIIVSTRWGAGELTGAAIDSSAGHLMLLRGFDRTFVWVHDPAAPTDATVARRYDREQFDRIAIATRGVVYVLLPPPPAMVTATGALRSAPA